MESQQISQLGLLLRGELAITLLRQELLQPPALPSWHLHRRKP
jgi:hypothetical protein